MKARRLLSLFLTAFIIFSNVYVIAENNTLVQTQPDYDIFVNVPVTNIYPSDEVYLTFDLNTPVSVYAIETEVVYDADYLTFLRVESSLYDDEKKIEIIDNSVSRLIYAITKVGNQPMESADKRVLTIVFKANKSGSSQVSIEKLKIVKDDLSYQDVSITKNITVNVLKKPTAEKPKPSYGGGGGGGGGYISVPGGNSTTAPITEPVIIPDVEPIENEKVMFSDLGQADWASDAIEQMRDKGIIQGTSENEFSPLRSVTRAEIAKMLVLAFSLDGQADNKMLFDDVLDDTWYYSFIEKAYILGIINGKSSNEFAPDSPASREEFATMLARCISAKGIEIAQDRLNINYVDEQEISDFAVGYVDMLYMSGIMSGDENGMFRPKDNLTRAEAAVGIHRLLSFAEPVASEVGDNE